MGFSEIHHSFVYSKLWITHKTGALLQLPTAAFKEQQGNTTLTVMRMWVSELTGIYMRLL